MDRWRGKTALVTGASAGIGYTITVGLLEAGVNVIGCARNIASLETLQSESTANSATLTSIKCDLVKEDEILSLFKEIETKFGHVDILVNNAGTCTLGNLVDGDTTAWRTMFELNILAITISTRETLRLLEKDGIETGHIVNINSMAGHSVPAMNYGTNFYTGTKHMLKALTTALSTELAAKKSKIRVTSLSPGLTDTPLIEGARKDSERGHFFKRAALQGKDVADAVLYVLGTPSHVVITELTIVPAVV